jgi:hypothetical protein
VSTIAEVMREILPANERERRAFEDWKRKVIARLKIPENEFESVLCDLCVVRAEYKDLLSDRKEAVRKSDRRVLNRVATLTDHLVTFISSARGRQALTRAYRRIEAIAYPYEDADRPERFKDVLPHLQEMRELSSRAATSGPSDGNKPSGRDFLIMRSWHLWRVYARGLRTSSRQFLDFVALVRVGPFDRPLDLGTREDIATAFRRLLRTGVLKIEQ